MDFKNSPEFAKEVEDLFRMFDEDGSGMIDAKEVQVAASVLLGVSLSRDDALEMIKRADRNGDGGLDFVEFKNLIESRIKPESEHTQVKKAFALYASKANSSVITLDSLRGVAAELGETVGDDKLQELIALISTTGGRTVDFQAFAAAQLSAVHYKALPAAAAEPAPEKPMSLTSGLDTFGSSSEFGAEQ
ncbi:Caltractin ICL1c [Diplonema papillatum]|nr:Caltractin ICL1c [Diplonema papillatum]